MCVLFTRFKQWISTQIGVRSILKRSVEWNLHFYLISTSPTSGDDDDMLQHFSPPEIESCFNTNFCLLFQLPNCRTFSWNDRAVSDSQFFTEIQEIFQVFFSTAFVFVAVDVQTMMKKSFAHLFCVIISCGFFPLASRCHSAPHMTNVLFSLNVLFRWFLMNENCFDTLRILNIKVKLLDLIERWNEIFLQSRLVTKCFRKIVKKNLRRRNVAERIQVF